MIPVWNSTPSDVQNVLRAQDDYDKLLVNWRSSEEFVGFPTWATDATITDEEPVSVGPNQIMSGGNWTVLQVPSIEPFVERRQVILDDAAKLSSSIKLAQESGATMSGVALQYLQRSFTDKLEGKAALLAAMLQTTFWTAARILAVDSELYEIETANLSDPPSPAELAEAEFTVGLIPNVPADAKADAETAGIWLNQLGASRETALAKAGIENPQEEIERAAAEKETELTPPVVVPGALDKQDEADEPDTEDLEDDA